MYKRTFLIILLLVSLFISSCAAAYPEHGSSIEQPHLPTDPPKHIVQNPPTEPPTVTAPQDPSVPNTEPPPPHGPIPPQPIRFEDFDAVLAFILDPDYENYNKKSRSAYEHMVGDFWSDGYILKASHKSATLYGKHSVYPDVTGEDVGISFWFEFEDDIYQVILYNTRDGEEYTVDPESQDIVDYFELRNIPGTVELLADRQRITVDNPSMPEVLLCSPEYPMLRPRAFGMLDATHYIRVSSYSEEAAHPDVDQLIRFLEGLNIVQCPLKK